MMGTDRGGQPVLLPVDVRDLLPADHPAWTFMSIVDELDLAAFHAAYRADGRGRPPYDPAMMVALLLYCASKRIRSARAVEAACRDDLGCRVITGGRVVDHATVDRFRRVHGGALRGLLAQSIRLCDRAGLVDLALIAGDGTKAAANAAMTATVDEAKLRARIARLTELVEQRQAHWRAATLAVAGEQPGLFDPPADASPATPGSGRAWRDLLRARHILADHERALEHLLAHPVSEYTDWQERLARDTARVARCQRRVEHLHAKLTAAAQQRAQRQAAGQRIPGTRPVDVDQHAHLRQAHSALATAAARAQRTATNPPSAGKVNITDPTSRIMPTKNGGYDQAHNVQATACRSQVILAIGRHDSPNDKQALTDLLAITRANLDTAAITTPIGVALFDNGYASDANFTAELPVTTLLIAVNGEAVQTGRDTTSPSTTHPAWQTMTARLAEPANRAAYKQRAAIIEPVFAQLFNRFGHQLDLHGQHVDTELHTWATSHNLAKLIRHRKRRRTRPPG
jgi:transposase